MNENLIKELDAENEKIANSFSNGKEVLDKIRNADLESLEGHRAIMLALIPCGEYHPDGRDESTLYSANLTIRLIDNEFKIRDLRKGGKNES